MGSRSRCSSDRVENNLVSFVSTYHDNGVGNSRFIRNARYLLLDSRYKRPAYPAFPSCRIVARGNRISREKPPKQRRPKIAVYVSEVRLPRRSHRMMVRVRGEEKKSEKARDTKKTGRRSRRAWKVAENKTDGEREEAAQRGAGQSFGGKERDRKEEGKG